MSTYDVRVHAILINKNARGTTYTVRWKVAGRPFRDTFATKTLAESFRSKLVVAQREGIVFDEPTGLPEPMARERTARSWYEHAIAYVDMKWPRASAKHRRSIADALATVTPALLATDRGVPDDGELRWALYGWVFNKGRRDAGAPPEDLAPVTRWLAANTVKLTALTDAALVRKALDLLALRIDGQAAAATTIARKRAVLYGALRYAVELKLLDSHPMDYVQWIAPKSEGEVDRRVVINSRQAVRLLAAVYERTPWLLAFFASMYFAALRPAEALHLRADECELPEEGWGLLLLTGSTQHVGQDWGDGGDVREDRELKHRAKSAIRIVPAHPSLVRVLRLHLALFGCGPDGRLFVGRGRSGSVSLETYTRVWRQAREVALTPAQQRSPLARRPYDLRHAAVSTWLNAGVPATQVAEWAGHSVHVLLKVYAKCIDGEVDAAKQRILDFIDLSGE